MKDKNEIGFQVTYKKAEKELVLSIIKVSKPANEKFVQIYFIKPIMQLSINSEEFLQLVTEFEMIRTQETETIIQYSTFEEAKNESL